MNVELLPLLVELAKLFIGGLLTLFLFLIALDKLEFEIVKPVHPNVNLLEMYVLAKSKLSEETLQFVDDLEF